MDTTTILFNKKNYDAKMKAEGKTTTIAKQPLSKNGSYLSGKKIDDTEELPIMDKIGTDIGLKIQQARLTKNLKQTDVAKLMNIPVNTYQTFENGTAIKNNSFLNTLGNKLGVKLI